ncbi:RNase H domain-containing protein [Trichonephila clavipes]|nr:RNase H domain-containing protein [Trichonephila clavipes]
MCKHVESLLGNEVADDHAKSAICDHVDTEDHMVLTSTEIYSRVKELICRTWVVPPVHPWYFQRHPGSAISFKGSRSYQTAFSRFSTGYLRLSTDSCAHGSGLVSLDQMGISPTTTTTIRRSGNNREAGLKRTVAA